MSKALNTHMKITEITTQKPLTPERARVQSLKRSVDQAKIALQQERSRQQQQRAAERIRKLQQTAAT